jgi:hypothetical protein
VSDDYKSKLSNADRFMSMFRSQKPVASGQNAARQGGDAQRRGTWVSGGSQSALTVATAAPAAVQMPPDGQDKDSKRGGMFSRMMHWDSTDSQIEASGCVHILIRRICLLNH